MSTTIAPSSMALLNSSAERCVPTFVTSNSESLRPSARILSRTFMVSLKKDFPSSSTAILKGTSLKYVPSSRYWRSFWRLAVGMLNCALIPSFAR